MKFSTALMFIIMISGIIIVFSTMINEANTQYPEANINASAWNNSKYDFSNDINNKIQPLKDRFETITDEKTGFFTKIGAGIIAIPYAIILVPSVVLGSLGIMGNISTSLLSDLGIPSSIVLLVLIGISIWGIFQLVKFFNKSDI